jgi:hypothetical protein
MAPPVETGPEGRGKKPMKPPRPRIHRRPKIEPEGQPEMAMEVQQPNPPDLFASEVSIPDWDINEPPNSLHLYNFAIKQMMILAGSCPVYEVRAHAIAFLAKEFAPAKAVTPDDGKRELIAKLRQALEAGAENAEIELEVVEEASRKEDPQ